MFAETTSIYDGMHQIMVNVTVFLIIGTLVVFGRWLRRTHQTLERVHEMTTEVNHAVNTKPPGDPTIYELVDENKDQVVKVRSQIDNLGVQLTDHQSSDDINFDKVNTKLDNMRNT